MHFRPTRPLLALFLLILASLACTRPAQRILENEYVYCEYEDYFVERHYECSCKSDGKDLGEFDFPQGTTTLISTFGAAECSVTQSDSAAPTEPPTEEPTEEPAATEPPADPIPLNPYLTGTFTTCDNAARYVNFSIAENAPPYDPATFKVLFNGHEAKCAPVSDSIFTCNYPPVSYDPPAGIQVFIGEELVNEFDFNGGKICDPVQPPTEEPAIEPAPTEDTGDD